MIYSAGLTPLFQSTPSVWRETIGIKQIFDIGDISIHSLRVEGDDTCIDMAAVL